MSENKNILRKYSAKWFLEGKHHRHKSFNRQISNPPSLPVQSFQCHYWRRATQVIISSGLRLKSQHPTTSDLPLNPWSQHWSRGRRKDQMCCFKWGLMFFHFSASSHSRPSLTKIHHSWQFPCGVHVGRCRLHCTRDLTSYLRARGEWNQNNWLTHHSLNH